MNERIDLYSSSLYDVATEGGCSREVYESLNAVAEILKENSDYAKLMSSAAIELSEKECLLDEAFGKYVHPFVLNFMKILCKRRAFEIFCAAADCYEKMYLKDNNIGRAKITTAIELSDEKKKEIVEKISKATEKEIIPEFFVDEKILGGILIETENSSIDASLTGKLESIKRFISKI